MYHIVDDLSWQLSSEHAVYKRMFEDLIRMSRLSDVQQFSTEPIIKTINVAEHSYYVALSALFIYDTLGLLNKIDDLMVTRDSVLIKALLHDAEECVTSDIPHLAKASLKDSNNYDGLKSLQKSVVDDLFDERKNYIRYWVESKDGISGAIVRLADRLALVLYLVREFNLGNKYSVDILKRITGLVQRECQDSDPVSPVARSLSMVIIQMLG